MATIHLPIDDLTVLPNDDNSPLTFLTIRILQEPVIAGVRRETAVLKDSSLTKLVTAEEVYCNTNFLGDDVLYFLHLSKNIPQNSPNKWIPIGYNGICIEELQQIASYLALPLEDKIIYFNSRYYWASDNAEVPYTFRQSYEHRLNNDLYYDCGIHIDPKWFDEGNKD